MSASLPPGDAAIAAAAAALARHVTETLPAVRSHGRDALASLPAALARPLLARLDARVDHEAPAPESEWVDADRARDSAREWRYAAREAARVPAAEWSGFLGDTCRLVVSHLVRPAETLAAFAFEDVEARADVPTAVVLRRIRAFAPYPYLPEVAVRYVERKDLARIDRAELEGLLRRIDRRMVAGFSADEWSALLDPLVSLLGTLSPSGAVPTGLLEAFFEAKGRDHLAETLAGAPTHTAESLWDRLAGVLPPPEPAASDPEPARDEPTVEPDAPAPVVDPGVDLGTDTVSTEEISLGEPGLDEPILDVPDVEEATGEELLGEHLSYSVIPSLSRDLDAQPEETRSDAARQDPSTALAGARSTQDEGVAGSSPRQTFSEETEQRNEAPSAGRDAVAEEPPPVNEHLDADERLEAAEDLEAPPASSPSDWLAEAALLPAEASSPPTPPRDIDEAPRLSVPEAASDPEPTDGDPEPHASAQPLWKQMMTPSASDASAPGQAASGAEPIWKQFVARPETETPAPRAAAARPDAPPSVGPALLEDAAPPAARLDTLTDASYVSTGRARTAPQVPIPPVAATPEDLDRLEGRALAGTADSERRAWFVAELFSGSEDDYRTALTALAAAPSWADATAVLSREMFLKHRVNAYSDAATALMDAAEARFRV